MSYCLNPYCQNPQNNPHDQTCMTCGNKLLLKERYRAIKPIGQGNFGRTLLAVDESNSSEEFCVIKQFILQVGDTNNIQKATELFEREASRLDDLGKHERIPKLLDYFTQEEHQYLVQEYIDGQDLAKVLSEAGTFNEGQIWELLNAIIPLLQYIHNQEVIHRDIKPQNIIRSRNGEIFLVDFGAAKVVTGTAMLLTGTSIGTPEFVAPEQTMGKASYSSDLYSLGVTCIYLLTGTSPFDLFDISEYSWVWQQYLVDNPVSDKLSNILDKLIETATSRRYQMASEVLKDINIQALNNTPSVKRSEFTNNSNWKQFDSFEVYLYCVDSNFISEDGTMIASAGSYYIPINSKKRQKVYRIQLYKTNPRTELLKIDNGYIVNTVAISPNKQILASGDRDNTIILRDVNSGKAIHFLKGWYGAINCGRFSPDSQFIASGGSDETVKLWDVNTGAEIRTLKGHKKSVKSIVFSPNGQMIASCCDDGRMVIWDLDRGRILYTLDSTNTPGGISCVAFSPDGTIIAVANRKKSTIKLWEITTERKICTLTSNSLPASNITFNHDGTILASGDKSGGITLWDINTKQQISTLFGHSFEANSLVFTWEGQNQILISGSCDREILKFRDLNKSYSYNPQKSYWQCVANFNSHTSVIDSIAISPDGKTLASASHDNTIKLWDIASGKVFKSINNKQSVYAIFFSPDGLTIASGDRANNIHLWDIISGAKIITFTGHKGIFTGINCLAFSPDGRIIASAGGDKTVKLWDVTTGLEIRTLENHKRWVSSVAFNPQGTIIVSGSADKTAILWDLYTDRILSTYKHSDAIISVAFSPDGNIIATGSRDKTIKLWQVINGQEISTLKAHTSSLRYITFSPNGEILASSSYDNDIKLWNIATKQLIFSLEGYSAKDNSIVFSADSQTLYSGSDDKTIKVWRCE